MANKLFDVETGLKIGDTLLFAGNGNIITAGTILAGNIQVTGAQSVSNLQYENTTYQFAQNLSSPNVSLTGGSIGVGTDGAVSALANVYAVTGQFTNLSSGNVLLTGGSINGGLAEFGNLSSANVLLTGGSITGATGAFTVLQATDFSSGNSLITSLQATNFSSGNSLITSGSITGATGAFTVLQSTDFSSGNSRITGGYADNFQIGANVRANGSFNVLNVYETSTFHSNLNVNGNLVVTGNITTVGSSDLTLADSIINMHTQANLAPLTVNDGKDIGLKMHFFDVADSHAFVGRVNDTGFLEYYARGSEGVGNTFVGTHYGTVKAGAFQAANNTPSTSTTSGALTVTGGAGIGDGLYVNGTTFLQRLSSPNLVMTGGYIAGAANANITLANVQAITAREAWITNFNTTTANITNSVLTQSLITHLSAPNLVMRGGYIVGSANANIVLANVQAITARESWALNFNATTANITTANVGGFTGITGTALNMNVTNANLTTANVGGFTGITGTALNMNVTNANLTTANVGGFTGITGTVLNLNATNANITTQLNLGTGTILTSDGLELHGGGIGVGPVVATLGAIDGNLWIRGNLECTPSSASEAAIKFRPGAALSPVQAGGFDYDGTIATFTPTADFGRAPIVGPIYTSGAGTNLTPTATGEATPQNLFPAANDTITLPVGTYKIKMHIVVTRGATSTTSATLRVRFAGAGTAAGTFSGLSIAAVAAGGATNVFSFNGVALNIDNVISAASATAVPLTAYVTGVLRVTTGGTFAPQYSMSAALTGATTATAPSALNSMTIQQLSSSGSAAATGGWA